MSWLPKQNLTLCLECLHLSYCQLLVVFSHFRSKMGLWSWFKSLVVVHLLLGYIFLASGFIVSVLMALGMVIWPFSKNLYRKYTYFLSYSLWSRKFSIYCIHVDHSFQIHVCIQCLIMLHSVNNVS